VRGGDQANGRQPLSSSKIELSSAERLLNERQAAEMLGVSKRALQAWRYRGGGPAYVCLSAHAIRYRPCDLALWITGRVHSATSEY
jgi:Helix-turn-helix domain